MKLLKEGRPRHALQRKLDTEFQGRELMAGRQTAICYIALGVPFLIVIIAFAGLTKTFPTFHGSDELVYHYPIIIKFAREYPHIDFVNYRSILAAVDAKTLKQLSMLYPKDRSGWRCSNSCHDRPSPHEVRCL